MRLFLLIDPLTPDQPEDLKRRNRGDAEVLVMAGRRVGRELSQIAAREAGETLSRRLARNIVEHRPAEAILNAPDLGRGLATEDEIAAVADALRQFAADILIITPDPAARPLWAAAFGPDGVAAPEAFAAALSPFTDPDGAKAKGEAAKAAPPPLRRIILAPPASLFAPRNDIVGFDETQPLPETQAAAQPPRAGTTGVVVIACMKNEGPYLLEWIAYHQTIGIHHFVIYTNDCSDRTDAMLDRLAALGHVTHVRNDDWKGNSPQQFALNRAMRLPVVKEADWLIHIDADEFINIRTGNGTFEDLLAAMPPETTNIAMTWRQFGNAGVRAYADRPVIEQFDRCAPSYLPKPHTAWGFKTATKNIGAYQKLSCHRPNKVRDEMADKVVWANGSGKIVNGAKSDKVWRSDIKRIGYDLVQLNHYALRSAQSFLVKRQRGRALHVDRSIGESYWVRMDWNTYQDVSIQRNLPRLRAAIAALREDAELDRLHAESVAWHQAKIAELMEVAEFRDLYADIGKIALTDEERIEEFKRLGID